ITNVDARVRQIRGERLRSPLVLLKGIGCGEASHLESKAESPRARKKIDDLQPHAIASSWSMVVPGISVLGLAAASSARAFWEKPELGDRGRIRREWLETMGVVPD